MVKAVDKIATVQTAYLTWDEAWLMMTTGRKFSTGEDKYKLERKEKVTG